MATIPAKKFVNVTPATLAAGGSALDLNGLVLSTSTRVPSGTVDSFPNQAAVSSFFGPASKEAAVAGVYFGGFTNSSVKPGAILFTQYNQAAVAAYLRGGNISALSLSALQALNGTFTAVVDGYTHNAGTVNFAAATSFSSAATILQTALDASEPTEASVTGSFGATFTGTQTGTSLVATAVTGTIHIGDAVSGTGVAANTVITAQVSGTTGGAGTYTTNLSGTAATAAITALSATMDVTVVASGTVAVGQTVTGAGVAANTVITALGTGTGGDGSYVTSVQQPAVVVSEALTCVATAPTVIYDSQSGAFVITSGITGTASTSAYATGTLAPEILLTQTTDAVLSQGAAAATPIAFMNAVLGQTQDWATFMLAFNPDQSGNSQKLLFSQWTNEQDDDYAFVCWDTDASPTVTVPATGSLGYLIAQAGYSGTFLIYEPNDQNLAAFVCGCAASIDFTETNGRVDFDFLSQTGIVAGVTDETTLDNLIANGYNCYAAVGTANQGFTYLTPGSVSGPFDWMDSYVNQIQLNNAFQLSLMELLTTAKSIPYNNAGNAMIESSLADDISAALNFGTIRAGVELSSTQIAEVNAAAGVPIDTTLSNQGWYLQVLPASPTVRQQRGSPPCNFWYTDGEDVQQINLTSVNVQ